MVLLACRCLNVLAQTQADPGAFDASLAPRGYEDLGCPIALGLAGVRVEHASLCRVSVATAPAAHAGWAVLSCVNCDMAVFATAVEDTRSVERTVSSFIKAGPSLLANKSLVDGAEIENIRTSSSYSPVFRVLVLEPRVAPAAAVSAVPSVNPALVDVLPQLQSVLTSYFENEEKLLAERVKKYEEEQRAEFDRQMAAAARDRETLWTNLCNADRIERAASISPPPATATPPSAPAPEPEAASPAYPSFAAPSSQPIVATSSAMATSAVASASASRPSGSSPSPPGSVSTDLPAQSPQVSDPASSILLTIPPGGGDSSQAALEAALSDALAGTLISDTQPLAPQPIRRSRPSSMSADLAVDNEAPAAIFELEGFETTDTERFDLGPEDESVEISPIASPRSTMAPPPSLISSFMHSNMSNSSGAHLMATSAPVNIPLNSYRGGGRSLVAKAGAYFLNPPDGFEQTLAPANEAEEDINRPLTDVDDEMLFVAPHVLAKTFREEPVFGELPRQKPALNAGE